VITATSGTITGTATITVTAATIATIAVTPTTPKIAAGATEQFTATATYTNGSKLILSAASIPAVSWSSGTTTVATVASTGVATGVAAGTSVITASAGTVSGSTTLTVESATLTNIAVSPAAPSVIKGSTSQLNITATFSDGSTALVSGASGTWSNSTATVATIGAATGIVTGVSEGTSTITVNYSNLSATATLTVSPAEYAFVTNFNESSVSAFSVGPGGSLVPNGPAVATGYQPFALVPDATRHFLYVGNYSGKMAGSVSEYAISATGALTPLATVATGAGPNGMTVNNGYLYVVNLGDSTVDKYAIDTTTGQLGAPVSVNSGTANSGAAAITFNSAGTFAYVTNFNDNTIAVFSVNATTGALTASGTPIAVPSGSVGPLALTIDPTGAYAYVADFGGAANTGDISQYSINATTGALTSLAEPTLAISGNPRWLTIDAATKTLYVPNSEANTVQVLSIGGDGTLAFTSSQALAAGTNPDFVALDPTNTLLYAPQRGGTYTGQTAPFNNTVAQFSVSGTGALAPLATPTITSGSTAQSEPAEIAFSLAY
jgi:6-phosphogluconolactonase (cycloisomerase 2 family)